MLDERVRAVLVRLEAEDADERARGLPSSQRSRQVAPTTGRVLFALVASRPGCRVLEIGGSRGYSTIWLAAGARLSGGRVTSLEADPVKCEAWRRNLADAGLEAELVEGDAFRSLPRPADVVFLDAEKDDYERLFAAARPALEPGDADRGRQRSLASRPARRVLGGAPGRPGARERDPPARPRARGVDRPHVLATLWVTTERRWSGRDRFEYGQWRYQRVGTLSPRPTGNRLASVGDTLQAPPSSDGRQASLPIHRW